MKIINDLLYIHKTYNKDRLPLYSTELSRTQWTLQIDGKGVPTLLNTKEERVLTGGMPRSNNTFPYFPHDTSEYVLGVCKDDEEKSLKRSAGRHASYKRQMETAREAGVEIASLILQGIERLSEEEILKVKHTENIFISVYWKGRYVNPFREVEMQRFWASLATDQKVSRTACCFACGKDGPVVDKIPASTCAGIGKITFGGNNTECQGTHKEDTKKTLLRICQGCAEDLRSALEYVCSVDGAVTRDNDDFMLMYLEGGEYQENPFISEATLDVMVSMEQRQLGEALHSGGSLSPDMKVIYHKLRKNQMRLIVLDEGQTSLQNILAARSIWTSHKLDKKGLVGCIKDKGSKNTFRSLLRHISIFGLDFPTQLDYWVERLIKNIFNVIADEKNPKGFFQVAQFINYYMDITMQEINAPYYHFGRYVERLQKSIGNPRIKDIHRTVYRTLLSGDLASAFADCEAPNVRGWYQQKDPYHTLGRNLDAIIVQGNFPSAEFSSVAMASFYAGKAAEASAIAAEISEAKARKALKVEAETCSI